jgi:DNA (cytosine-5)-methyltransferase 1
MKNDHAGAPRDTSWPVEPGQSAARPPIEGLSPVPRKLRFIDLFAGLGGFHLAMDNLGHECVFASELKPNLRELYKKNFGMEAHGDITKVDAADIPAHDVLCAGFPCQPFSKSGKQNGLEDPKWGNLFDHILRVLKHHKPRYLMLENVPNLERHRKGTTWETILKKLSDEGYKVRREKLSPHRYGIPQVRERLFIVGDREGLAGFNWPRKTSAETSIDAILDTNPRDAKRLSEQALACIKVWQEFLDRFPGNKLPSFPIWTMEFGANYPFEETSPYELSAESLSSYLGSHGRPLEGLDAESMLAALPSYARKKQEGGKFPDWKIRFIRQNRAFYDEHRGWIDEWMPQLRRFPASLQKFEWNCKGEPKDLSRLVIQFRASGVRVKKRNTAPSLIAMTTTQVPVITWEERYMTPRECARLQGMESLALPGTETQAYAALGNAVNADLVGLIALALLERNSGTHEQLGLLTAEDDRPSEEVVEVEDAATGEPVTA